MKQHTVMSELPIIAPLDEQQICVTCGFCCDGMLFSHASLNPGERGNLPEKIEEKSYNEGDKDYFRLPCPYFSGRCTIYDSKRANICWSYRCQLLKDFAEEKVTLRDAIETIRQTMQMRNDLLEQYHIISGNRIEKNFRQLLIELGKVQKSVVGEDSLSTDYELLLARCNIFEALLMKHFHSAEDFEKMIMR